MSVVVEVWTDGSGIATGGPIGWAYCMRALDRESGEVLKEAEASGGEAYGTNNRAELLAVAEGLYAIPRAARVTVVSDSADPGGGAGPPPGSLASPRRRSGVPYVRGVAPREGPQVRLAL